MMIKFNVEKDWLWEILRRLGVVFPPNRTAFPVWKFWKSFFFFFYVIIGSKGIYRPVCLSLYMKRCLSHGLTSSSSLILSALASTMLSQLRGNIIETKILCTKLFIFDKFPNPIPPAEYICLKNFKVWRGRSIKAVESEHGVSFEGTWQEQFWNSLKVTGTEGSEHFQNSGDRG